MMLVLTISQPTIMAYELLLTMWLSTFASREWPHELQQASYHDRRHGFAFFVLDPEIPSEKGLQGLRKNSLTHVVLSDKLLWLILR
jgi:hypothetical protein